MKFTATIKGEVPDDRRKFLNRLLVDIAAHVEKAIGGSKAMIQLEYEERKS